MESNFITKEDLLQFRVDLLNDLKEYIEPKKPKEPEVKWLKSGPIRKLLNVSHSTLQILRIKDLLHPKKVNGRYYYNVKEVNDLFNKKERRGIYE